MAEIIVIGGGAAGMMAAVRAADNGNSVVLYEKNEKLGKKLYITGKGRCNVTNDTDVEGLLSNVLRNPKFLYSAFYSFDSAAMMAFLESEGLRLKTERGSRVFPQSDKSSDVIRVLEHAMKRRGVDVRLKSEVKKLLCVKERCMGVRLSDGTEETADAVIVATGGVSYSSTGSTGDGHRFAKTLGLTVTPLYPALVPLQTEQRYVTQLQGLSLRNVTLCLKQDGKVLFEQQGELLFTHFGISGPLALTASSVLGEKLLQPVEAGIDLKPALSEKQLDERVQRDFRECQNSFFKNSLQKLLPAKLIPVVVELSGIAPDKKVNAVTREERGRLVACLKAFPFTITGTRDFSEAIVTRGGVSVREINPATMESKKVRGLYFAGEVLDLDAKTGGYNLQIAWSTGYLAGKEAK